MKFPALAAAALLGCGATPVPTITFHFSSIPAGTISVNMDAVPYDECYLLPKRYALSSANSLVFERKCFLFDPSYTLYTWTYDANCCVRASAQVDFEGEKMPGTREIRPSLTVEVPLVAKTMVDCRPGVQCGPQ